MYFGIGVSDHDTTLIFLKVEAAFLLQEEQYTNDRH